MTERAWRDIFHADSEAGDVDLRAFAEAHGLAQPESLAELIELDAQLRRERGRAVSLARYLRAHPAVRTDAVLLDAAIEGVLRAMVDAGGAHDDAAAALSDQHPELARQIRLTALLNESIPADDDGDPADLQTLPRPFGPVDESGRARYTLHERLGVGSQGAVYLASDHALSSEDHVAWVAIKLLGSGHAGEARHARRVDHPNVAHVLDQGSAPDGTRYIVYRFAGGRTLDEWRADLPGPVPQPQAASIVARIADGIHAAHATGIVHLDLKPANVVMSPGDKPTVTDFGSASRRAMRSPEALVGNLAFMAPEQYRGEQTARSPAADVYALGGLLFWLLTDAPPLGDDPELVARRLGAPDTAPPSPRAARRDVDRDLDAICRRALDPDPGRRYRSAAELALDLDAFLAREPLRWANPSVTRRALLYARRSPIQFVLTTALTLSIIVGIIVTTRLFTTIENQRTRAELQRAELIAEGERSKVREAQRITETFIASLDSIADDHTAGDWLGVYMLVEQLADPISTPGRPLAAIARADRIELAERVIERIEQLGRAERTDGILWRTGLGLWLVQDERYAEARRALVPCVETARRALGADDAWTIRATALLDVATVLAGDADADAVADAVARLQAAPDKVLTGPVAEARARALQRAAEPGAEPGLPPTAGPGSRP